MQHTHRRHLLALIATTSALWLAPAHAQQREIAFGIISTESSSNLKTAWQPLLEDMQTATGYKINAFFSPDYAGVIEGMRFNKVQVAWMGNKSGMEAVDRSNGEVFAKVVQHDGTEGYYTNMLVHKDSKLQTLDDVLKQRANLVLAFGEPNSTSGTLVPSFYAFGPAKVDPLKDFKRTLRANHETNMLAVVNKQVDVCTVASDGVERLKIKDPAKHAQLRLVWRSPLISSDPLLWRKDLDATAKEKIRSFLLGYGKDDREKAVLRNLTWSQFRASDDSQLLPIRQLSLAGDRNKIDADTRLSADEKASKLKEIDMRLAELDKQMAALK